MANYFDAFFLLKFRLWSQSEKLLDLTFARIESNPISVSFIHFLRLKKYRYNTTFFFSLQPEICWIRIILGSSLLPNYSHTDYFYQIIAKDARNSSHSRAARFIFTPISTFRWTKLNYKMVQNWYFCLVLENQNNYKGDLTNVVLSLIFLFFKISSCYNVSFELCR